MTAPDLAGFCAWMETRPYSAWTKRNYVRNVGAAYAAGATAPEDVDAVFEGRGRREYRSLVRTALRAYADFKEATV